MTFSDTFTTAGPIGVTEVGSAPWIAISGTWSRVGGLASCTEAANTNPFIVVELGSPNIDLQASTYAGNAGGDALYFRVSDASNWWRLRRQFYYYTYYTYNTIWTIGPWGAPFNQTFFYPPDPRANLSGGLYYYDYVQSDNSGGTSPTTVWSCSYFDQYSTSGTQQNRSITSSTETVTNTIYYQRVILEKCVAGVVSQVKTITASSYASPVLRVIADGSLIKSSIGTVSLPDATDSFNISATKHGIGKGGSDNTYVGSALDNFSLSSLATPVPISTVPSTVNQKSVTIPYNLVTANPIPGGIKSLSYQISTSSNFSTGLISGTVTPTGTSGVLSVAIPTQGTWYYRAKAVGNDGLVDSAYSITAPFVVAHVPAVTKSMPAYAAWAATSSFNYNVTDTATDDSVSAYQVVVERNDTGASVVDTGKVARITSLGANTAPVVVSSTYKDVELRWKVRVWDSTDVVSSYTGYSVLTLTDVPVIDITNPVTGTTAPSGAPTFTWTVTLPSGRSIASTTIAVVAIDSGVTVWSQTLYGSIYSATPSAVILVNTFQYSVTVSVVDSAGLSGSFTSLFSVLYTSPESVVYTIDADGLNALGYVEINWSNTNPDPDRVFWKVYRRTLPDVTWELLASIPNELVHYYRDYLVRSGVSYMYTATQVADRYGELIESPIGTYALADGTTLVESRVYQALLDQYWLVDLINPSLSLLLPSVSDAADTEEYESASYNLVGRGRHRDYGDRLGYTGTLTSRVRIPEFPSTVRLAAESLRAAQETCWLRTPFGKLFKVAIGNLGWTPLAGVGSSEMGDLSIPYEELG